MTVTAGVTAVSAGNHAMAVAHAARAVGTTAKVCMPTTADPARVQACRELGAEIVLLPDIATAFAEATRIEADEGRAFVHHLIHCEKERSGPNREMFGAPSTAI